MSRTKIEDLDLDQIKEFLASAGDSKKMILLSENQQELLKRLQFAQRLFESGDDERTIANQIKFIYKTSLRQAWNDVSKARSLFAWEYEVDKAFLRAWGVHQIKKEIMKVSKAGDHRSLPNLFRELYRFGDLEKEDPKELPNEAKAFVIQIKMDNGTIHQLDASKLNQIEFKDRIELLNSAEEQKSDDEVREVLKS